MNTAAKKTDWRDRTDSWYDEMIAKWEYTRLVYTGKCFDEENIKSFLKQRVQGEGDESYKDRLKNYDPELLFPMLIGSLSGQVSAVEDQMIRVPQPDGVEGLGQWNDPGTPAGKLWQNADGDGMNYPVLWRTFNTKLLYYMTVWIYVDGKQTVKDETGAERVTKEPSIHIIDPQKVTRVGMKNGRKSWVMVSHKETEGGENPEDDTEVVEKRTVYKLDSWKRYRKVKDDKGHESWADDMVDNKPAEGPYEFYETREQKQKTLPIYCVKIPFDQYLAYLLARKSIVLLNKESERDHLVRNGSLITKVDESSPNLYDQHKDQQRNGEYTHNYDPGSKLYFAAPPMEPAKENREIIKEKRENFFKVAYQQLNDQAAQVTATEIRQQTASGVGAFLSLISSTLDEAERKALFIIDQIEFPNNPEKWGLATIKRSTDFVQDDQAEKDKMLREMWFGADAMPSTEHMLHGVTVELYERNVGELDDDQREELKKAVKLHLDEKHGSSRNRIISGDGQNTPEPVIEL